MYKILKPKNLVEGQFFYENDLGMSILFIVTEPPKHVATDFETGWKWKARCVYNGKVVNFFKSTKYSGYGPRISTDPEYLKVLPELSNDETGTDT